jgi:hypothetical protein
VDDLDRRLLAFVGAHRFVTVSQAEQFLGLERRAVDERLAELVAQRMARAEYVRQEQPGLFRVTSRGLTALGSRLSAPGFDLADYRHEVGVVWLWLAGWDGALGEAERVLSAREMRSLDGAAREAGREDRPFAVPAGRDSRRGGVGDVQYPDVMLVFGWGRVAAYLVTWPYRQVDLEELFAGHRACPEVADVIGVFVDDDEVGRQVSAVAERHGVSDRLRVRRVVGEGTARPSSLTVTQ